MRFTVVWSPNAEAKLAALWMRAADRQAISGAANAIDASLRDAPQSLGESRPGGRRIYHCPPLGVIFTAIQADRRVTVLDVWRFEQRS